MVLRLILVIVDQTAHQELLHHLLGADTMAYLPVLLRGVSTSAVYQHVRTAYMYTSIHPQQQQQTLLRFQVVLLLLLLLQCQSPNISSTASHRIQ